MNNRSLSSNQDFDNSRTSGGMEGQTLFVMGGSQAAILPRPIMYRLRRMINGASLSGMTLIDAGAVK